MIEKLLVASIIFLGILFATAIMFGFMRLVEAVGNLLGPWGALTLVVATYFLLMLTFLPPLR